MVKKIFIILIFSVFLILLCSSNIYAANSVEPLYDEDLLSTIQVNLSDALASRNLYLDDYNYIICGNDMTYLKIYCFEKTLSPKIYIDNYGNGTANLYFDDYTRVLWYTSSNTGELTFYSSPLVQSNKVYNTNSLNFFYSTYPIYNDNTYTDFFFQSAQMAIVEQAIQGVKMTEVMMEIIFLLPILILIVCSYLSLRKGLETMMSLFHKA